MNPRTRRIAKVGAAAAALTLVLGACSSDDDSDGGSGGTGGGSASGSIACLDLHDLYAIAGPESDGIGTWEEAGALAAELGSDTQFPTGSLDITAPGTESGTYDAFIELGLETTIEERLESGALAEEPEALTRRDYSSQANDNQILQGITGSKTSFGWVGFAFANEAGDDVIEFEIDGGEGCVAPTSETIADGSYPLSRPLFIYVNTARAAESGALCEYVDTYVSDLGLIDAVELAGYVVLDDATMTETREAWGAEGLDCGTGNAGNVRISGSSTVEPISQLVKELLNEENGDITVDVDGPGTGDGFKEFCAGNTDISDASRPIKDEEIAICEENGIEYVELTVAFDGITVMTSAQNPGIG